jgi:hypothetical protein
MIARKVAGGDVAGTDSNERVSSLSSSWLRSSSASFQRRLDFLAGGGCISGEGGVDGAGGIVGRACSGGSAAVTVVTATGGDDNAGSSHVGGAFHCGLGHGRSWDGAQNRENLAPGNVFTLAFRSLTAQHW